MRGHDSQPLASFSEPDGLDHFHLFRKLLMNRNSFFSPLLCSATAFMISVGMPHTAFAAGNLVSNGSFETGAFTNWAETGDTTFNGVQCGGGAPSGLCTAFFGPFGTLGGIQQSLATVAGTTYTVSFKILGAGDVPSSLLVNFGDTALLNLSNPLTSGFQTYSFDVVATGTASMLKFQFRDDLGFVQLDDVAVAVVAAVPEPETWLMLAAGLAALGWRRRASANK